ncbi:MAG TPA: PIN domain-containing protein, partial [Lamprocystis sp. (in: g-proteobacteria)]|nr:PIN domain-containing protein [Lamprocystis sp. (in: g-proteobacteria)]
RRAGRTIGARVVRGAGSGECGQPRRGARRGDRALANLAQVDVSTTSSVEAIAEAIAERGVKAMDALHVASAITAGATWLLTTDLRLIRKMRGDDRIVVADPIDFIRYWQGDHDEDRV